MERKYTFFISSTYRDLIEERKLVASHVADIDEIPIGMEQFGAIDVTQWTHITRLIDTSDYYVLIVAGRYGFIDPDSADGLSFTHREFRYARDRGVPIIAMIHSAPDRLPIESSERDPSAREKLDAFRTEVKRGRLVSFYSDDREFLRRVTAGIAKAKAIISRPGWIRNVDLLNTADVKPLIEALQMRLATAEQKNRVLAEQLEQQRQRYKSLLTTAASRTIHPPSELEKLQVQVQVPIVWRDGNAYGREFIGIVLEDIFVIIGLMIFRKDLTDSIDLEGDRSRIAQRIANLKMKSLVGEGTTFHLGKDDLKNILIRLVELGFLMDESGSYRVTELGVSILDWLGP